MVGANLPDNDNWTTALLTNPEVLAVDQDPLGQPAQRVVNPDVSADIWVKKLADGSSAVGFFNRTSQPQKIDVLWRNLGLRPRQTFAIYGSEKIWAGRRTSRLNCHAHGCMLLGVK